MGNMDAAAESPYRSMFILWLSWACVFAAYSALENLQSSLHASTGLGVISITVVYLSKALSSSQGTAVVNYLTPKWTLILGFLCHMTYILANVYPSSLTLLPTAILLGLATGPLWICFGLYITVLSLKLANSTNQSPTRVLSRCNGLLNASNPTSYIIGNLVSACVLKFIHFEDEAITTASVSGSELSTNASSTVELWNFSNSSDNSFNTSNHNCGSQSCPEPGLNMFTSFHIHKIEATINMKQLYCLLAILAFINICGILVTAVFLKNLSPQDLLYQAADEPQQRPLSKENNVLMKSVKTRKRGLCNWKLWILIPKICYIYVAMAIVGAMFNKVYVSCFLTMDMIGYMAVARGLTGTLTNVISGSIGQCLHRNYQFAFATTMSLVMALTWLFWEHVTDWINQTVLVFLIGSMSGAINAINLIHFSAFLGANFADQKLHAFSFYHCVSGVAMAFGFLMSNYLCSTTQIYIFLGLIFISVITYGPFSIYQEFMKPSATVTTETEEDLVLKHADSDSSCDVIVVDQRQPNKTHEKSKKLKTPVDLFMEENLGSSQISLATI